MTSTKTNLFAAITLKNARTPPRTIMSAIRYLTESKEKVGTTFLGTNFTVNGEVTTEVELLLYAREAWLAGKIYSALSKGVGLLID